MFAVQVRYPVCRDELRCRPEYPTEAQTEIHQHRRWRDISLPSGFDRAREKGNR